MISQQQVNNVFNQGLGGYVDYLNNLRLTELKESLTSILNSRNIELKDLETRTISALNYINKTDFNIHTQIIDKNRGGNTGIHGFIAEFADEGITNAERALNGKLKPIEEILNNNGNADLKFNGHEVQMKFYANIENELKQAKNYNMDMKYPKDHYEIFEKIMNGETHIKFNGEILSENKIKAIKKIIGDENIRRNTKEFTTWMKPSVNKYSDVQKSTIDKTLDCERERIKSKSVEVKKGINDEARGKELNAYEKAEPSFSEATSAAEAGAVFQAGINFGMYAYEQHNKGKELWQFNSDDWKACGIKTSTGAIKGGISGYSIYGLTNICGFRAPSAAAITSEIYGLMNAVVQYRLGKVDDDEFTQMVIFNAIDCTGAGIGAAIGQIIIPFPVAGALFGSIATTTLLGIGKHILSSKEQELIEKYQKQIDDYMDKLDNEYRQKYYAMIENYKKLGELQDYSFNENINIGLQFIASVELAQYVEVPDNEVVHDVKEIDDYFLN